MRLKLSKVRHEPLSKERSLSFFLSIVQQFKIYVKELAIINIFFWHSQISLL